MKKIISLFQRNYDGDHLVRDEVVAGAEWVLAGEGVAMRKWDGTCCLWKDGRLWKRYDAKQGKTPPDGFVAAQDPDPKTGHWPGWVLVGVGPEDRWHREALEVAFAPHLYDGTYELIGPKINGNSEKEVCHRLVRHNAYTLEDAPRNFQGVKKYLENAGIEGIVWHRENGDMVKIKRKDFGL